MTRSLAIGVAILAATGALAARSTTPPPATPIGPAVSCIPLTSIDHTQVHGDKVIDFHMRGRAVYRNTLPDSCPELGFEEGFSYSTSQSQLCSLDIITVLRHLGGGLDRGASCGLGTFQPVKLLGK